MHSAGAHARTGYDDRRALDGIDRLRLIDRARHGQAGKVARLVAHADLLHGLLVIEFGMLLEHLGNLDRHGTVDKRDQMRDAVFVQQVVEMVEQLLRAFERKARNHHIAAGLVGLVDDPLHLTGDIGHIVVYTVAIS